MGRAASVTFYIPRIPARGSTSSSHNPTHQRETNYYLRQQNPQFISIDGERGKDFSSSIKTPFSASSVPFPAHSCALSPLLLLCNIPSFGWGHPLPPVINGAGDTWKKVQLLAVPRRGMWHRDDGHLVNRREHLQAEPMKVYLAQGAQAARPCQLCLHYHVSATSSPYHCSAATAGVPPSQPVPGNGEFINVAAVPMVSLSCSQRTSKSHMIFQFLSLSG